MRLKGLGGKGDLDWKRRNNGIGTNYLIGRKWGKALVSWRFVGGRFFSFLPKSSIPDFSSCGCLKLCILPILDVSSCGWQGIQEHKYHRRPADFHGLKPRKTQRMREANRPDKGQVGFRSPMMMWLGYIISLQRGGWKKVWKWIVNS